MPDTSSTLRGCPHCGLVQRVPTLSVGQEACCPRCGQTVVKPGAASSNQLCAAIALAALICYPLGISLPVLRIEQLGHSHEASIWGGSIALVTGGHIAIGLIVLICSIVIPLLKLAGLFALTALPGVQRRHQARIYRWIEWAGRWGMIDVLLVAILVAAIKLGDMVAVTPGPGATAFAVCVLLSLLASAAFDPHAIWEETQSQ